MKLLVQRGQVVGVVLRVPGVGDQPDDGALQRGPPQEPLADQVHVPGGVHAEADGGARQQHAFVGQQQREAARDLDPVAGGHRRMVYWNASPGFARGVPRAQTAGSRATVTRAGQT